MRRASHRSARPSGAGAGRIVLAVSGLLTLLLLPSMAAAIPLSVEGGLNGSKATFKLPSLTPSYSLASSFWGADARVYYPTNSTLSQAFNATPLTFVRWPGGAVADAYNLSANRIYGTGGHYTTPPSDIWSFARWCGQLRCHAIVQLPAEIDSPSTAAYEVHYIESVVGFHPAYYEIGNEPAQWNHQGIPWVNWTGAQRTNATPSSYASIVQRYVAAIHAVDPSAKIVGLPGIGMGGYQETSWIQATVQLNGPNLSALAIHVYPGGAGPPGVATAAQFYATLQGPGSLAVRIPADRAAIVNACPRCANLQLIITELGAGNAGGSFAPLMASFADVPYIATEIIEGMQLNVPNIDLFCLQGTYAGSILQGTSGLSAVGKFYNTFLTQVGPGVLPMTATGLIPGVHLVATGDSVHNQYVLLAVNTNTTVSQPIHLTGSLFPLGAGSVRQWNLSTPGPSVVFYPGGVPADLVLPPESVLLVQSAGAPVLLLLPNLPRAPAPPTTGITSGTALSWGSLILLSGLSVTPGVGSRAHRPEGP